MKKQKMCNKLESFYNDIESIKESTVYNEIIEKGGNKKIYKYTRKIFNELLLLEQSICSIFDENKSKKDNIKIILITHIKPLIERYIDLYNIYNYGKDYIRCLSISSLSEDYYNATEQDQFIIHEKQHEQFNEIENEDLRKIMTSDNGEVKYKLFPCYKIKLFKESYTNDSYKILDKLFDYYKIANNYTHINPDYVIVIKPKKFIKFIQAICNSALDCVENIFGVDFDEEYIDIYDEPDDDNNIYEYDNYVDEVLSQLNNTDDTERD